MPCTVGVRFPLFRPSLRPEGDWNMCMFYVAGIICVYICFWLKCYCIWTFALQLYSPLYSLLEQY